MAHGRENPARRAGLSVDEGERLGEEEGQVADVVADPGGGVGGAGEGVRRAFVTDSQIFSIVHL